MACEAALQFRIPRGVLSSPLCRKVTSGRKSGFSASYVANWKGVQALLCFPLALTCESLAISAATSPHDAIQSMISTGREAHTDI